MIQETCHKNSGVDYQPIWGGRFVNQIIDLNALENGITWNPKLNRPWQNLREDQNNHSTGMSCCYVQGVAKPTLWRMIINVIEIFTREAHNYGFKSKLVFLKWRWGVSSWKLYFGCWNLSTRKEPKQTYMFIVKRYIITKIEIGECIFCKLIV